MGKLHHLLTLALLGAASTAGWGAVTLDTGYDNGGSVYYGFGAPDNYWIKIASYEPPAAVAPVAPARVVNAAGPGWAPVGNARWVSPRTTTNSSPGTSPARPAYSIYRKCFCLLEGFANPQLSFRIRGDDRIQVWLNTVTTQLLAPVNGNIFAPTLPHSGGTSNIGHFRAGRNCLYVLVEDQIGQNAGGINIGHTGFVLSGTVNAAGLMPGAAFGTEGSFGPCGCPGETQSGGGAPGTPTASNDSEVVRSIIRFAESRRLRSLARLSDTEGGASGLGH